ncbi:MAG: iron-sulfur cluster co-chaperone HscB C-terminal domain-containing protein, partial [Thiohalobacteraceae bacterium]
PAALAEVQQRVDARLAQLTAELTSLLGAETGVDERALHTVQQMQFFRKLAHECDELEAELE